MENEISFFEIEYENQVLKIQKATIKEQVVFHISFADGRKPLVIGRILNYHDKKVWTSFPEGRQQEAENIGPLIVKYYLSIKK